MSTLNQEGNTVTVMERVERLPLTIDACKIILRKALKLDIRHNVITGNIDVFGNLPLNVQPVERFNALVTYIHSKYRAGWKGCDEKTIRRYLEVIADEARYNPIYNEILACTWDKTDCLNDVYQILGITEDALSKTLVRKWFHQGICLLNNDEKTPFGADGVLVLCGSQGVGKTSFFRKISIHPEWFGEGLSISQYDKDTSRRVVTSWIAELGELEATLKGDIASLKAFITASTDRYRLPYGRSDVVNIRRTNLCATCNTLDFLVDSTGNRRFWTVPVGSIDLDALDKLNPLQLWAQIYYEYAQDTQGFRLTRNEQQRLEERNGAHQKALPAEDEIRDIFTEAEDHPEWWQDTTITNFMGCYPSLQKYSAQKVSRALKKLGYETQLKRYKDGIKRCIRLPIKSLYSYFGR